MPFTLSVKSPRPDVPAPLDLPIGVFSVSFGADLCAQVEAVIVSRFNDGRLGHDLERLDVRLIHGGMDEHEVGAIRAGASEDRDVCCERRSAAHGSGDALRRGRLDWRRRCDGRCHCQSHRQRKGQLRLFL